MLRDAKREKGRSPEIRTPVPERQRLLGGKVQLAPDLYGIFDRPSDRAAILVHLQYAFYILAIFFVGGKMKSDRDPLEHKHVVLCLYLPYHLCIEAILIEGNLTRCQRA